MRMAESTATCLADCPPGNTDRIDLATFYPFLAFLVEQLHFMPRPSHPALFGEVKNKGDPSSWVPVPLPGGEKSCLLVINDSAEAKARNINAALATSWWPAAPAPGVAEKLMSRVIREGNVLPILTAVSLAILAEIYTTTPHPGGKSRVRLGYGSAPIADFGIAKGSVRVPPEDRLAYLLTSSKAIIRGQDPDDHYWLYFTTITGEELILDCNLFTFNAGNTVELAEYAGMGAMLMPVGPVCFEDREMRKRESYHRIHIERRRVSVLRNVQLHKAVEKTLLTKSSCDAPEIKIFMEDLLERPAKLSESKFANGWMMKCCQELSRNIQGEHWQDYPDEPPLDV